MTTLRAAILPILLASACSTPQSTVSSSSSSGDAQGTCTVAELYNAVDDLDADGVLDAMDNCASVANPMQQDGDADGLGDVCDNCPAAANTTQADTDTNGLGDACDPDVDGDGVSNEQDNCRLVANPGQEKTLPNATMGDRCNPDVDGDGVLNAVDNCPRVANPAQAPGDPSLHGAACGTMLDTDGDNVPDVFDNCPSVPNTDQGQTSPASGLGDACNPDMDGDGVPNALDNCARNHNTLQADGDRDGIGDDCDVEFCVVVDENTPGQCLNPGGPFLARPGPDVTITTGQPTLLHLLANRTNLPISFTWFVLDAPQVGQDHVLLNAAGVVSQSTPYEYHYATGSPALFVSNDPGQFTLQLQASLNVTDPLGFPATTVTRVMNITVTGTPLGHLPATCGSP